LTFTEEIPGPPFVEMRIDFKDRMIPLELRVRMSTKDDFVEFGCGRDALEIRAEHGVEVDTIPMALGSNEHQRSLVLG
jgi:hypothetical protein